MSSPAQDGQASNRDGKQDASRCTQDKEAKDG